MKKDFKEIVEISNSDQIKFIDNYFLSSDGFTVLGEIAIKYLLFIPYRDTDAGSNPREYYGLKKSNIEVLKSMISHPDTFRFLHSGVIVSTIGVKLLDDKKTIIYSDACLTNGNQTRFLFLLVALILMYKKQYNSLSIDKHNFNSLIRKNFEKSNSYENIISRVTLTKINKIVNFLTQNQKYKKIIDKLNLDEFLSIKIRIQINLINSIIEKSKNGNDEYTIGTLIAEANNNTQNVKKDDIFGNKYKSDLEEKIFKDFKQNYGDKLKIEYRQGEIADSNKVHILTLLRPIVSVGLLTRENKIYNYSNQREPVYRLFEKLFKSKKASKSIDVISKCVPYLYELREDYLSESLEKHKRNQITEYIKKGVNGEIDNSIIGHKIVKSNYDEELIEKEVKSLCRYNIEHIAPVVFFRIRNLLNLSGNGKNAMINLSENNLKKLIDGLSEAVYKKYIEDKFSGLPTSLTTLVRSSEFFKYGEETYVAYKSMFDLLETDFISENRILLV